MSIESVRSAIEKTVPISLFNKGLAGKVFDDVRHTGTKVVIKNNTPACVLMSPTEYLMLMNKLEDMELALVAEKRLKKHTSNDVISQADVDKEFGFDENALDTEGVEFD